MRKKYGTFSAHGVYWLNIFVVSFFVSTCFFATKTLNHFRRNKFDLVSIDPGESYGEYCNPLVDFPHTGNDSSGGFAHGKIITCGGILSGSYSKQCYYYSGNKWEHFGDLTERKNSHGKLKKDLLGSF